MSNTTNLDLERPDKGDAEWHTSLNSNMYKIDTTVGSNTSSISDMPQVYIETGTFNYTTGDVITLPVSVDAINEYNVSVIATTRDNPIGDIYVTKTTSNFTVHCSSNNTGDTFVAVIYYIGDIASYGGSIYRRWYVSPDASITDHSVAATVGSLAWIVAQISTNQAVVELPANRTYTLTANSVTLGTNIELIRRRGAIISVASGKTLTINGSMSMGIYPAFTGDGTVVFGPGYIDRIYPEWREVDGTADNTEIQLAVTQGSTISVPVVLTASTYTVSGVISLPSNTTILARGISTISLAASTDANLFHITGDNVTVKGISADGVKASQASGSFLKVEDQAGSIDNLTVEDCEITDFKEYGVFVANACSNFKFLNNKVVDVDKTACLVAPDTATESNDIIRIEGNHIDGCGVNGIQVYNSANLNNSNVFINNNYLIDTTAIPIEVQRGYRAVISGNIIEGGGTNGISLGEYAYVTITGNVIEDQSNEGIEIAGVGGSGNWIVSENSIYNCGTGIISSDAELTFGSKIIISDNLIDTTTSQEGIEVSYLSNVTVRGNLIIDPATFGIRVTGTVGSSPSISDILVTENNIKFEAARSYDAVGIYFGSIERGRISNNLIITDVVFTNEYTGLIYIARGNEDIHIVNNSLIATTPIDQRGVYAGYSDSGKSIYILRNIIKNMKVGIQTVANTNPKTVISGNFFEDISSANITAYASHKTDKKASSPTQGALWNVGEVVWETAPTDSNPPGWICSSRVKTEMRVAAVVTATTMEVDSTTGMTAGDIIGVELDNGTWHWTTIDGVTDGDTVELTAGLAGDGAAINNDVVSNKWLPLAELGTVKV